MNDRTAPRSIEQYLAALRVALAGEDPALVQDALYDAEEYLRAEVAANAGGSEADTLELISSTYGAPEEVAEAYRTTGKAGAHRACAAAAQALAHGVRTLLRRLWRFAHLDRPLLHAACARHRASSTSR
jgi:uncharacterized membrane protein